MVAVPTIDWPGAVRLERNLSFFATLRAGYLMHFALSVHLNFSYSFPIESGFSALADAPNSHG